MKTKKFALTALISSVYLLSINSDNLFSQELTGEDERIIISVDSVERSDFYPENLKRAPIPGYTTTYKSPKRRNDFAVIYFTVVEELTDFKYSKSILIDDRDETCREWEHSLNQVYGGTGTIKANGYILYEMPKDAMPVHLKYFYHYGDEVTESKETKIGQQDIDLLHVQ